MAKLIENLTWIQDGEKATSTVFNRALKELAGLIDSKDFEVLSSTAGLKFDIAELDSLVQLGDLVYKSSDGKYYQALGGDEAAENIVGTYTQIDGVDSIVWNGIITKSGLTVGSSYYLSDTTPGAITDTEYDGAIKIGIAISETQLLQNAVGSGSGGDTATSELNSTNIDSSVQENDLIYRASDGKIYPALADGTDAANVIGRYNVVNGRPIITYSGEITGYTGLIIGENYYLSNTTPGQITNEEYNGNIKIGTAISDTDLFLDIDNTGATSGSAPISLDDATILDGASDGDFVYKTKDGDIGLAMVDGTDKENVIGVLQVDAAGRNSIVYNGLVDGFAGLELGSYYYLSPTEAGKIQVDSYPGAIKVGIANTATELIVDIDKAPSSSGDEELEYQFLLSDSSYSSCYFNVFSELNTMIENNGGDELNVVYSSLNTSYVIKDTFSVQTNNIITENVKTFLVTENATGDYTREYSVDGGNNWVEVPEDGKIWYESGYTDFRLRYTSNVDGFELKSFGVLLNDQGYVGNTRVRLREYIQLTEDLAAGTGINLPYGQKYTNDNQSLTIIVEGIILTPVRDYTEIDNRTVSFNVDLSEGDIILFEEYYGYVDVSLENTDRVNTLIERVDTLQRLDKQFEILDINNITYDIDDNIEEITYVTGNKEDWVRDGVLTQIDYYDTDGSTKLATNEFTYDSNGRLLTTTWTNY